jgi:hypothetical protein
MRRLICSRHGDPSSARPSGSHAAMGRWARPPPSPVSSESVAAGACRSHSRGSNRAQLAPSNCIRFPPTSSDAWAGLPGRAADTAGPSRRGGGTARAPTTSSRTLLQACGPEQPAAAPFNGMTGATCTWAPSPNPSQQGGIRVSRAASESAWWWHWGAPTRTPSSAPTQPPRGGEGGRETVCGSQPTQATARGPAPAISAACARRRLPQYAAGQSRGRAAYGGHAPSINRPPVPRHQQALLAALTINTLPSFSGTLFSCLGGAGSTGRNLNPMIQHEVDRGLEVVKGDGWGERGPPW